jgi:hypothetical protein
MEINSVKPQTPAPQPPKAEAAPIMKPANEDAAKIQIATPQAKAPAIDEPEKAAKPEATEAVSLNTIA